MNGEDYPSDRVDEWSCCTCVGSGSTRTFEVLICVDNIVTAVCFLKPVYCLFLLFIRFLHVKRCTACILKFLFDFYTTRDEWFD